MAAVNTLLIPQQEMASVEIARIRNSVIDAVVAMVCKELNKTPEQLVIRDVQPASDLATYMAAAATSTADNWRYDVTSITLNAWTAVTAAAQMGDQRWVAFFGVRDLRHGVGIHVTSAAAFEGTAGYSASAGGGMFIPRVVNSIRFNVGGSDKAMWDTIGISAYFPSVGFTPSPVIIPQNTSYQISERFLMTTTTEGRSYLQLIGIVVEPRGRTISP